VTGDAGVGLLQRIIFRLGMCRFHDVMLPMTVAARRGVSVAVELRTAMNTCAVHFGNLSMTLRALNRFEIRGVGHLGNIAMTGRARQRRMHGLEKTLRIDGQGNFFSSAFLFQAGHGMTGQTDLVCRGRRAVTRNGNENHRGEGDQTNKRRPFFFRSMNANRSVPPVAAIADGFTCRDAFPLAD
jgi:hypothetical protein